MNGKKANNSKVRYLEDDMTAACVWNGGVFAPDHDTLNHCDISIIRAGAAIATRRAAELGLLSDDELASTRYMADKLRAEEEARRTKLAEEEAKLRAELEALDGEDE